MAAFDVDLWEQGKQWGRVTRRGREAMTAAKLALALVAAVLKLAATAAPVASGKNICLHRESNPGPNRGRIKCYHYTMQACLDVITVAQIFI